MAMSLMGLTIILALLAVLCIITAYQRHDGTLAAGFQSSWRIAQKTLPAIALAWIFAGFVGVLVRGHAAGVGSDKLSRTIILYSMIFLILLIGCMAIAYRRGDGSLAKGLDVTWKMFNETWLLLVVAWIFAGYLGVLLPPEFIEKWLGPGSGWKGIAIACAAGGLTPGGVFVALPIVGSLYRAGAGEGVLVAYLTAWSLYALGRVPFEINFFGLRLTAIRFASVLIFPPLAGVIARLLFER